MFKYLLPLLITVASYGAPSFPYVKEPTNTVTDQYVVQNQGGTNGHNKWVPMTGGGGTVNTNVITTNSNAGVTNIIQNAGFWKTNSAGSGSISNIFPGNVLIGNTVTVAQGGGDKLSIGAGPSSSFPDIESFEGGGGILFSPLGSSGAFFYNRTAGGAPHVTMFRDLRTGGGVNLVGPWSFWQNNKTEQGSTYTSYADSIGGSGGALRDLPVSGSEIIDNCPTPYFVLAISDSLSFATNCTLQGLTNTVNRFRSTGWGMLTNIGVPVAFQLENYWLTNHRNPTANAAGDRVLQWNTNKFPWATAQPTNVTYYLRTNNIETWLTMYADTLVPTGANTEYDIDAATGATFWEYPNGVNGIPGSGSLMQPMITPNTVHPDVTTMYQWDIGGLTLQDTSPRAAFAGYVEQVWNMFGKAVLYPAPATYPSALQEESWSTYYPNRMGNHGMIVNYLYPPSQMPYPMSAEYKANGIALESGTFPAEAGSSGTLRQVISMMRPAMYNLTNWQSKTIYFCLNSDQLMYQSAWSYGDVKDFLSGIAMLGTHEWIRSNDGGALTNANLLTLSTNAGYRTVWRDPARNRLTAINWGLTNQIVSKLLYNGDVAVWFVNEDASVSTNLTVNWANLNFASNYPAVVTEVWTNTALGSYTNSFTVTVPAASSTVIKFSPVNGSSGLSNYVQTAVAGAVGPGTVKYIPKFSSTSNINDSIMVQMETNLVEMHSVATNTASTNAIKLVLFHEYTSSLNYEALSLESAANANDSHRLRGVQGSGHTALGIQPLSIQDTWTIEPTAPISGHTAGYFYPGADNAYAIGTIANRVLSVTSGPAGYTASPNGSSANFGSIGGFGLAMSASGIDVFSGVPQKVLTLATNIGVASSGNGSDYGVGTIVFGASLGTPDIYIHRPVLLRALSLSTNNNSTTKAQGALVFGSASDDNAINRAGGDLTLAGGPASGSGTNGDINLGTFLQGSSGFAYNSVQTNRLSIHANPINLTTNSATTVLTFTVPTSLTVVGAKLIATTQIKDATDVAMVREEVFIGAVNKAGTVTATNSAVTVSSIATGSATIANTWSSSVSSTTVSIKVSCVTGGINSTTSRLVGARLELDSDGASTVTWQ